MDFKDFLLALYENDYFVIYSLISILVLTILFVLLIVSSRKGSKKKEVLRQAQDRRKNRK